MKKRDMYWAKDNRWFHYDGLVTIIHDDAPQEVKDSFKNYCDDLEKEFGSKEEDEE